MNEKVLIVDDSMVNRKLLAGILKKEGYRLLEAVDGQEAVDITRRQVPDLILLDIMMPVKDGFEACAELQSDPATRMIPVIFLSAKTAPEDKVRGLEIGGSDYITKPFDRGEVLARVRTHLQLHALNRELMIAHADLLKKQESLDEDLKAAARIQQSLLPLATIVVENIDFAWKFLPCQRVGGDILNLFRLDESHLALYVLDVSGHGVPSAMVAVSVYQMLRSQPGMLTKKNIMPPPHYRITSPAKVLQLLDSEYPIERFDKYFTMSYIVLNNQTGALEYSSAAHPPPILLRADGTLETLEKGGTIIGMGGVLPFEEGRETLAPGDKLFLYTDGIVEYQNEDGEFYGQERFRRRLQALDGLPVGRMIDGVIDSLMDFGRQRDPGDDISLLGLEFRGSDGQH